MKHQQRPYSCGIASIQNALECLGIKRTQGQIRKVCHCDPAEGTHEHEIMRGLLACGAKVDEWVSQVRLESMQWLQMHLMQRGPAILCVDAWEHWCTAIGIVDSATFLVFDPARGAGLKIYDWNGLATRWRLGKSQGGPSYYGIGVSK